MRDFVQNRVPHLIDSIEKRQRPRERDPPIRIIAPPEPPSRMIELKSPANQPMPADQLARKIGGFVEIHSDPRNPNSETRMTNQ
jgi:hypothetical protein